MASLKTREIGLYVAEEVELYREIYRSIFAPEGRVRLLDVVDSTEPSGIRDALAALKPDVVLMGARKLDADMTAGLEHIRRSLPRAGIVLLVMSYDVNNLQTLRGLVKQGGAGMAVFLKQSLERIDQICSIVESVSDGHVILDPALTSLLLADRQGHPFLREFTHRELEILSLLSSGYTNTAIAEALYIDVKTVQRHINNMYSKLRAEIDYNQKHLRVSAARLFLETTGELLVSDTPGVAALP